MAKPRKNSRRQRLIALAVGEKISFPIKVKASVSAQLCEIRDSTGQSYSYETIKGQMSVTRRS